jgi:hypothetical protein
VNGATSRGSWYSTRTCVCSENFVRIDLVSESLKSATMVALVCFILRLLASPFKSNSRLEAENAALRHQLTVLQRKVRGLVQFTNSDRLFSSSCIAGFRQ